MRTEESGLRVIALTKEQMKQRGGRCDRTEPGDVHHLYTKEDYVRMPEFSLSELVFVDSLQWTFMRIQARPGYFQSVQE